MKSKFSAIAALLFTILLLTACSNEGITVEITAKAAVETTAAKTDTPQSSQFSQSSESAVTEEPDDFTHEIVPTPDGSTADKTEAAQAYRNNFDRPALKFDFGFLRYASPVFQSSLDTPKSFNFNTMRFEAPYPREITDPEFFRVKAGDRLKCGITVTKADWYVDYQSGCGIQVQSSLVKCEGEVTWEGILYRFSEDDYQIEKGDLAFYPDPLKNDGLLVICGKNWKSEKTGKPKADLIAPVWSDGALESGGGIINVGNYFDSEEMYDGIFGEANLARVKMTLKDLVFESDESGSKTYAKAVNCEIVK